MRVGFLIRRVVWLLALVLPAIEAAFGEVQGEIPVDRPAKPNVLFIAVDDLRPQLGCYGDTVAFTPNLDRLAKMGVVFNRAYCQQAVCAPSRASVLTGRRPDATKVWDLRTHFRAALPDVVTLPQHFKQHGYDARNVGKIYHDPKNAQDPISWSAPEIMAVTDEAGPKYVRTENEPTNGSWKAAATECVDVPDNAYVDGKVADEAIELIGELKDTTFFLAVGFRRPHLPFTAPKRYWDLYQPDEIPGPSRDHAPENAPAIALHNSVELRGYTDIPDVGPLSPQKIRELRHGYYASVSYIDHQIGRLLDELERRDLLSNTIVVLWSDHGYHLGELDLWSKTTNFETDTRVPLIIASPRFSQQGVHSDALVELVDLYPTLADLAGLPIPGGLEGSSMAPLIANPGRTWKKATFSQFPRPWMYQGKPEVMGYSVRTAEYRYTEWIATEDGAVEAAELYHYDDGIETANLIDQASYKDVRAALQRQLYDGWKNARPENAGKSVDPARPNILFILVDDLGWADLSSYGNAIHETPNIDRLAAGGMTFTDAYAAAPICSASRASLLTGKSPARLGFEFVTKPDGSEVPEGTLLEQPTYPRDLPLRERTIAEQIHPAYVSGYFGKWHLTQENDRYLGWGDRFGPLQQGFAVGSEHRGSHSYGYSPAEKGTFGDFDAGEFPADSVTEASIRFLEQHRHEPFMLYYSMYYVHTPVKTRCKWLYDKYRAKLGAAATEELVHYAAFIETMDHHVGQLLRAVEALGLDENTLIVFTSDNGGDPRFSKSESLRGGKWTLYEAGIRVPTIVRWKNVIEAGSISQVPINGYDWYPTLAELTDHPPLSTRAIDGQSIVPVLRDPNRSAIDPDRVLYWHFPFYHPPVVDTKPQSAIRMGKYKAIYFYEDDRIELYDLDADRAERRDISLSEPQRAAEMKRLLLDQLDSVGARLPQPKK